MLKTEGNNAYDQEANDLVLNANTVLHNKNAKTIIGWNLEVGNLCYLRYYDN